MHAFDPGTFEAAWCVMLNLEGATTSELREGSSGRVLKPNSGRERAPRNEFRIRPNWFRLRFGRIRVPAA